MPNRFEYEPIPPVHVEMIGDTEVHVRHSYKHGYVATDPKELVEHSQITGRMFPEIIGRGHSLEQALRAAARTLGYRVKS